MTEICVHDFRREVKCIYKEERYSARDNGAVLRHSRIGNRKRSADDQWTFGKESSKNGYMHIGSARIHRIIATAFHGTPPSSKHIVDHIDTNRQNNRPENLRWLTRLENILLNPITLKRIKLICGSVEAFLEDPSSLCNSKLDPNFAWMRKVSPEEAKACFERMQLWAKSGKVPSGCSLGEWVFKFTNENKSTVSLLDNLSSNESKKLSHFSLREQNGIMSERPKKASDLVMAITSNAAQRQWRIPTEFPSCPPKAKKKPVIAYAVKLIAGAIFARNHLSTSIIFEAEVVGDGESIYVMCQQTGKSVIKPWSVAKVTFEDGLYVHTSIGTFFTQEGAEKQFCLERGLEWAGGDTIDDYC